MIIAIPSVTQYIQNSRKSALVDTASSFIDGVRTKVNEAKDFAFFDTDVLYLVPVGDGEGSWKSCVSLEKGGSSPFGDWTETYVGVTYDGKSYNYYFYGIDDSKQGIEFATQKDLADKGSELVKSGMTAWSASTCGTGEGMTACTFTEGTPNADAKAASGKETIVVVPNASCTYKAS